MQCLFSEFPCTLIEKKNEKVNFFTKRGCKVIHKSGWNLPQNLILIENFSFCKTWNRESLDIPTLQGLLSPPILNPVITSTPALALFQILLVWMHLFYFGFLTRNDRLCTYLYLFNHVNLLVYVLCMPRLWMTAVNLRRKACITVF